MRDPPGFDCEPIRVRSTESAHAPDSGSGDRSCHKAESLGAFAVLSRRRHAKQKRRRAVALFAANDGDRWNPSCD